MNSKPEKSSSSYGTNRIEALSDGIFAFAMTLLVLTLTLPDSLGASGNSSLDILLIGQLHKFLNYFFSFVVLATFWLLHHQQFHWIKRADRTLLGINIASLMFVALLSFSTDISGDFSGSTTAEVFFACNVMVLGILFFANWAYATSNHRLVDPGMSQSVIVRGLGQNMIIPVISVIVIVLAFIIPKWSLWIFLAVPLALLKPHKS